jgi:hypothetical protein
LRAEKNVGEELLEYRYAAWSRLLALFRAIHGGVQHDDMQMPAYSGSLFDPDRFPFLEGRAQKTKWLEEESNPLPISDRTILHILEALQYLEVKGVSKGERVTRRLSFQELDVEQIGHIYESLLDHTTKRANGHVLGLAGTKGKEPEISLAILEEKFKPGRESLVDFLVEETGKSESALNKLLGKHCEVNEAALLAACGNDQKLYGRVLPFANLLRSNRSNDPVIIPDGSVYVTEGTDRRSTGTHYTPKTLTEPIVQQALEPLVYDGPAEGRSEDEWKLLPAERLLDLKICDMACGSGAFLVQACRYLSERLVQAWSIIPSPSPMETVAIADRDQVYKPSWVRARTGEMATVEPDSASENDIWFPLPLDHFERLTIARRMIAQRCLYGVDKNRLAVEMCKLSLWLLTLAKDKPFTFIDHAIRCGDSLVGISSFEQLMRFSMNEKHETRPLFEQHREQIKRRIDATMLLRRQIEEVPSNSPQDIERKSMMLKTAEQQTRRLTYAADLLLSASWQPMSDGEREAALNSVLPEVVHKFRDTTVEELDSESQEKLSSAAISSRFHWPLEFPEVFNHGGFDAFVSNPPFMHGRRISTTFGTNYLAHLKTYHNAVNASADLIAYFALRMYQILRSQGCIGFISTQGIAEGDTRETSLDWIISNKGSIASALPDLPWPGQASVRVCTLVIWKDRRAPNPVLAGQKVGYISSLLSADSQVELPNPARLHANKLLVFTGTYVYGRGFVLSNAERLSFIQQNPRNKDRIRPYLRGEDINRHCEHRHEDWVIDFGEMSEKEARQWPELFDHLQRTVEPERAKQTKQVHEACFWKHWDKRPELYSLLARMKQCLVHAFVGKHIGFAFVDTNQVIATPTPVFATESRGIFAALQSSIHWVWVVERSSKMGTSIRYTPSDCFQTFPLPASDFDVPLEAIGLSYEDFRLGIMRQKSEGLTKTYNRFHEKHETSTCINSLRELHVEMDCQVASAYGWNDLDLGHGFHNTKQGVRFTLSETARRDVLHRLLKLNHERYAAECKQAHLGKKKIGTAKKRHTDLKRGVPLPGFDDDDEEG